mmetsp:Transcript_4376/g.14103  ORF Transcript_4376/g.14103 Transcript_4376/m.14103 type:complete len:233 (+) Transcript_4376:132-830(+)
MGRVQVARRTVPTAPATPRGPAGSTIARIAKDVASLCRKGAPRRSQRITLPTTRRGGSPWPCARRARVPRARRGTATSAALRVTTPGTRRAWPRWGPEAQEAPLIHALPLPCRREFAPVGWWRCLASQCRIGSAAGSLRGCRIPRPRDGLGRFLVWESLVTEGAFLPCPEPGPRVLPWADVRKADGQLRQEHGGGDRPPRPPGEDVRQARGCCGQRAPRRDPAGGGEQRGAR